MHVISAKATTNILETHPLWLAIIASNQPKQFSINAAPTAKTKPPMRPSQLFFGLTSGMSLWLPPGRFAVHEPAANAPVSAIFVTRIMKNRMGRVSIWGVEKL